MSYVDVFCFFWFWFWVAARQEWLRSIAFAWFQVSAHRLASFDMSKSYRWKAVIDLLAAVSLSCSCFCCKREKKQRHLDAFWRTCVSFVSCSGVIAALSHRVSVTCFWGFSRRWSCSPLCRWGVNNFCQQLCQLCCGLEWFQQLDGAAPYLARSLQDCCLEVGTRLALSYCRVKDVFSAVLEEKGLSETRAEAICRLAVTVQVCYDNGIRAGGGRWSCFCVSRQ